MKLYVSTAPHIHARTNTRSIMLDVILALLPAAAVGVYCFGLNALKVLVLAVLSAVVFEYAWLKLLRKPVMIDDLSAVVTGLILGLNLPSTSPWWLPVIGSAVAIVLIKQLFGGIGHNFMNPAMAARAILLTSWPAHMTNYVLPTFFSGADAVSAATPLALTADAVSEATDAVSAATDAVSKATDAVSAASNLVRYEPTLMDLFLGNIPGTIGEVCKVAILAGFVYLLVRKVINGWTTLTMIGSFMLLSLIFGVDPIAGVLSGGLLFGAVFMATDYTTTPMTIPGQIIFGVSAGLLVAIIRNYGAYPEGTTYAILLMNVITPLIDKYVRNRVYGKRRGE